MKMIMEEFSAFDWSGITYPQAYCRTIFNLVMEHSFRSGLEVGFDQGASALAFLRAAPEARLTSIDITECYDGQARIARSEVADRHTFIKADSRVLLLDMIKKGVQFDYIYIDGDHLFDAALQDMNNASELLAPRGIMIIDDADPNHTHFGVYKAMQEFCMKKGFAARALEGAPSHTTVCFRI